MAKITLQDVVTLDGITAAINNNNDAIEVAIEKTLSRDGTSPNAMEVDFDMNGNQILNLPLAVDPTDPVRLQDMEDYFDSLPEGPQGPQGNPGTNGTDGRSFVFRGAYSGVTAYVVDDTVLDNGSTWINILASTGVSPPTLPTTSNANWVLMAAKGTDGVGTGDVTGPVASVDNEIALFSGTGGKTIKRATTTGLLKAASGVIAQAVAGTDYYNPGGTDVALADGGTGASLVDPNADRILFWDDSAGAVTWLTPGTNLSISGTTLNAAGGSASVSQKFTATGTYTRSAGCVSVDIMCLGAGGGSSGCTGVTSNAALCNPGAAGAESILHLAFTQRTITGATQANPAVITSNSHGFQNGDVVQINSVVGMTNLNGNNYTVANRAANTFELSGTNSTGYGAYVSGGTIDLVSVPVTIGAGGTAGTAAPTAGGTGGTTSFGGYCNSTGGAGGPNASIATAGTTAVSTGTALGGTATGGDLNIPGQPPSRGWRDSGTAVMMSNIGGHSRYGVGGTTAIGSDSQAGQGYGSGAGGGGTTSSTSYLGAIGAPGLCLVVENFF